MSGAIEDSACQCFDSSVAICNFDFPPKNRSWPRLHGITGRLGASSRVWTPLECLGTSGSMCERLGVAGTLWECLRCLGRRFSRSNWQLRLPAQKPTLAVLACHDRVSGRVLESLDASGVSGHIWEHLRTSGGGWYSLGVLGMSGMFGVVWRSISVYVYLVAGGPLHFCTASTVQSPCRHRAGTLMFCSGPWGVTFWDIGKAVWKCAGFPTKCPIYNIKGEEKENCAPGGGQGKSGAWCRLVF